MNARVPRLLLALLCLVILSRRADGIELYLGKSIHDPATIHKDNNRYWTPGFTNM